MGTLYPYLCICLKLFVIKKFFKGDIGVDNQVLQGARGLQEILGEREA